MFEKYLDKGEKYLIRGFVGEPGVGKSCVMQQIINNFAAQGINVWSTRPFFNARRIYISDLGHYDFNIDGVQGGVLILDELGIDMNNRNYKDIDKDLLEFFKLYRHYRLNIYVVSQGIDVDITVRRLINRWYKLVRVELNFILFRIKTNLVDLIEVENNLVINNGDWQLEYTPGRSIARFNISKSFKYFNSFALPENLKHYDLPYWFDLNMVEPEQENQSVGSGGFLSKLLNKLKKEGATTPPKHNTFPDKEIAEQQIDYSKLSREELLDLWKREQI